MTNKIKFGTDGWRAIIADDFTIENVSRVAEATAEWLTTNVPEPSVVLGYDTRFGGKLFAETVAKILAVKGIKVLLSESFCSTPMVSLGTVKFNASLGIVITASHNPPAYNGFKLKGYYGGPLLAENVEEIESLIPEKASYEIRKYSIKQFTTENLINFVDLETLYVNHIKDNFNISALHESGIKWAYDAMYGAGQNVIKRLFPETSLIRCENNPSFMNQAPEPIEKNLHELSEYIRNSRDIDFGLATDGDADRLGLFDNQGNFVDSHHMILLLIQYLHEYKDMEGSVVTAFSTTNKIKALCSHYGLEYNVTKIGFKYICEKMIDGDVLLGGEESGGMAVKGHIPERDGIWIALMLWEMMTKTGKSLRNLIEDMYSIVGRFDVERIDLHLNEELKHQIMENCQKGNYNSFGVYQVTRVEDLDGYKYFLGEDKWIMIRASGTEPVLRIYAEAQNREEVFNILESCKVTLLEKELA